MLKNFWVTLYMHQFFIHVGRTSSTVRTGIATVGRSKQPELHETGLYYTQTVSFPQFCWETIFWVESGKYIYSNLMIKITAQLKNLTLYIHVLLP